VRSSKLLRDQPTEIRRRRFCRGREIQRKRRSCAAHQEEESQSPSEKEYARTPRHWGNKGRNKRKIPRRSRSQSGRPGDYSKRRGESRLPVRESALKNIPALKKKKDQKPTYPYGGIKFPTGSVGARLYLTREILGRSRNDRDTKVRARGRWDMEDFNIQHSSEKPLVSEVR